MDNDSNYVKDSEDAKRLLREHSSNKDKQDITEKEEPPAIIYGLEDSPPIALTLLTALQHAMLMLSAALSTSSVVADVACVPVESPLRSHLFCTTIFMAGLCTILQTGFGIRLPIFQGPSSSFLVPLLALHRDPMWQCTAENDHLYQTEEGVSPMFNGSLITNSTGAPISGISEESQYRRLQYISGALMMASLLEVALGAFGLLNILLRFIGPITVSVTITLIGISLSGLPVIYGRPSYWMAIGCAGLILVFILYFQNVGIPLPRSGKISTRQPRKKFHMFQLIPILLGIIITWGVSAVLTAAGCFSDDKSDVDYLARSDSKTDIILTSPWIQFTYPGQFGLPRFHLALTLGFMVAIVSSIMESVGDYYAAQVVCQVPRPTSHAISRGILVEGLGSIMSGAVGAGHATTSYSGNIAVLSITKNASRMVMYTAGVLIIFISIVGKAGAVFTAIPNPILGGVLMVTVGSLISIGMSSLSAVQMTSARNLLVVGVPIMAGLTVPKILDKHPEIISTGNDEADRVLTVVLGTPMFLGVVLSLFLDNTVPGSLRSRGLADQKDKPMSVEEKAAAQRVYTWQCYARIVKIFPWLGSFPFLPDKEVSTSTDDQDLQNCVV